MAEKTMKLEIVAPDGIFYTGEAAMVELNTMEGEIGVYPDHIPMTMIVAPGMLTITELTEKKQANLSSGFMEIQKDKMTILTEKIEWSK